MRASGLHVAAANTSGTAELLLQGTGCLRVGRRSLRRGGWRGCRLPSDAAPITYAGLEQLGGGRLIGLDQLIRPRQTPKPYAQRLDLLTMRLDCLARPQPFPRAVAFCKYLSEFILTMIPEGPPRGSYSASWLRPLLIINTLTCSLNIMKSPVLRATAYHILASKKW